MRHIFLLNINIISFPHLRVVLPYVGELAYALAVVLASVGAVAFAVVFAAAAFVVVVFAAVAAVDD